MVKEAIALAVGEIQITDLAFGTGLLLTATHQSLTRHFRRANGDNLTPHSHLFEKLKISLPQNRGCSSHSICQIQCLSLSSVQEYTCLHYAEWNYA